MSLPEIPKSEQTPTVKLLLAYIEALEEKVNKQDKRINDLEAEVKRLKKYPKKPTIKPNKLPKKPGGTDDGSNNSSNEKRSGSNKRSKNKTLKIDKEEVIQAEDVPEGSIRKGYQDFIIQELMIKPEVTKYRLERWKLPDGGYYVAKLPEALASQHFGPTLRAYILYQYHHQCVTQPLLYEQLQEWNFDISKGQLSRLLTESKDKFHQEKVGILAAGIKVSNHLHTDDTGARHQGTNGYCTHIGNQYFA